MAMQKEVLSMRGRRDGHLVQIIDESLKLNHAFLLEFYKEIIYSKVKKIIQLKN